MMGHLKEKYTEEYFTGVDKNGKSLGYGATSSLDSDGIYTLRDHDKEILQKIDVKGKNILALGCGRGEEIAYVIENGANHKNTVGVDFSAAAIEICKRVIKDKRLKYPQLYTEDALEFILRFQNEIKDNEAKKFDVVIMFDFVEHVPRGELSAILIEIKKIIKKNVIFAVNTPAYKYDNDVIKDGYDSRNLIGVFDKSDDRPETEGMHCNKYSVISLQKFMEENGYANITEAHYFIDNNLIKSDFGSISYYDRWVLSKKNNIPVLGEYSDDILEYPYSDMDGLGLRKFRSGNLNGISVITTESYMDIAYPGGNTDIEMMNSIKNIDPVNKVIFDVGTFVGVCSMLFSKMVGKDGKVLGFEPNPSNRNRAFLNLSHNTNISSNVTIYKCALGSENKTQDMLLSPQIDMGHSSTSRLEGSHSTIRESDLPDGFEDVEVEVRTLDSFVTEKNIYPDVLKVDIEGAEYDFLLGSIETIRKVQPIFFIELHSQYCASKCSELLVLEGYEIEILHEEQDNRIMVMAKHTDSSRPGIDVERMKFIDDAFSTIKTLSSSLAILNNELQIKDRKILGLTDENNNLRVERENINAIRLMNDSISNKLSDIENSLSWKITKPLRKTMHIIKIRRP